MLTNLQSEIARELFGANIGSSFLNGGISQITSRATFADLDGITEVALTGIGNHVCEVLPSHDAVPQPRMTDNIEQWIDNLTQVAFENNFGAAEFTRRLAAPSHSDMPTVASCRVKSEYEILLERYISYSPEELLLQSDIPDIKDAIKRIRCDEKSLRGVLKRDYLIETRVPPYRAQLEALISKGLVERDCNGLLIWRGDD